MLYSMSSMPPQPSHTVALRHWRPETVETSPRSLPPSVLKASSSTESKLCHSFHPLSVSRPIVVTHHSLSREKQTTFSSPFFYFFCFS
ncbi:unnamed protein product [Boreogadus saida]